jgi:dephospho-CoA kinase
MPSPRRRSPWAPTTRARRTTPPEGGRGARGRPAAPLCIALTGGIGAGKSEALAAFAECGAATLSSDAAVHELYEDPEVVAAVAARFGPAVMTPGGAVDRALLGPAAFGQEGGIAFLEELLYPRIGRHRQAWIDAQRARTPPPPLLVCEVPLLFEAGLADRFDAVLVVTAPDEVRRRRVEARGQDFDERRARQMPEEEKVARADRFVRNDGDLAALRRWVADRFREYAGHPCDASSAHR